MGSSWSRIEPVSPALAGRFLTTAPPEKSPHLLLTSPSFMRCCSFSCVFCFRGLSSRRQFYLSTRKLPRGHQSVIQWWVRAPATVSRCLADHMAVTFFLLMCRDPDLAGDAPTHLPPRLTESSNFCLDAFNGHHVALGFSVGNQLALLICFSWWSKSKELEKVLLGHFVFLKTVFLLFSTPSFNCFQVIFFNLLFFFNYRRSPLFLEFK